LGDVVTNNETPEGNLSREQLANNIVKIALYAVLIWFVFSGKIDWDQAGQAKDFLEPGN